MGLFDRFGGRRQPAPEIAWHVFLDGDVVVAEDGRGAQFRVPVARALSVRVVPLTGGDHHQGERGGWQVALARAEGDLLVGRPMADWRKARTLAQLLCEKTELPLDELTERMFSRVGQFPHRDA